jgi:hypothetical protein
VIRQGRRGLLSGFGSLTAAGNITADRFLAGDGTSSLPAFSYVNDPDTGDYRSGANSVRRVGGTALIMESSGSTLVTFVSTTIGGLLQTNAGRVVVPRTVDIDAVTDTISITSTLSELVIVTMSLGSITPTSTPFMANGTDGQSIILVRDDDAGNLVLTDEATMAGSNLRLGPATTLTLGPRCSARFRYSTVNDTGWVLEAFSDNTP